MPTADGFLSIPESYPEGDRLGVFVAAMAMAANDVEYSMRQAADANQSDYSDEDREVARFYFQVRVTNGFLFEGISMLKAWERDVPVVQHFLAGLPIGGGKEQLKEVRGLEQKIGSEALEHVRHTTFHYPTPGRRETELAEVIADLGDVRAAVDASPGAQHTFPFADSVALQLSMGRHDAEKPDPQAMAVQNCAAAFVILARRIHLAFCELRSYSFGAIDGG